MMQRAVTSAAVWGQDKSINAHVNNRSSERAEDFVGDISICLPLLSFVLIPVSEKERVWPRNLCPGPFWPSENDERLGGGRILGPGSWNWSWGSLCSLLWVVLRERWRLPRLPMARYSGPSSSPSPESPGSGWEEWWEEHSVNELPGTEMGLRGGVTPCSFSSGMATHTQGSPRQPAGDIGSVKKTPWRGEVRWAGITLVGLSPSCWCAEEQQWSIFYLKVLKIGHTQSRYLPFSRLNQLRTLKLHHHILQ